MIVEYLIESGHRVIGLDLPDAKLHIDPEIFEIIYYGSVSDYEFVLNSLIFLKEVTIPRIREEDRPWCSISFNPSIVHPMGVVTLSISCSG